MASEWEVKRQICQVGRRMYEKNFVAANDGNISYRLGDGRYLCTPTGVSKGFLQPADIAVVDEQGKQLAGGMPRTSEIMLHLEIYHELSGINAVCHAHPPHATAFAVAGLELPTCILPEVEIFIGQVPIAEYDTPGTKTFAETILPHLRNKANTILLANHGAVACDRTLEQAYFHLETLDQYCRILLLAKQVGSIRQLSEGHVRDLLQLKQNLGIDDPRLDGDAQVCTLAGSDEFLRGFSMRAIAQHTADANGHGRGAGIAGAKSQAGQPQPLPERTRSFPAVVAGRQLAGAESLGSSSETARKRAMDDQVERLVQVITDRIVQMAGDGRG
ncbi:MAG TPA: class II aldolase/adducin family protein [Phycisphaerae bacterium]|nr:class II aldolase/adducin family protein [Phycisphaerae bacterium]